MLNKTIKTQSDLENLIYEIHIQTHKLCRQAFDKYLPCVENIGIYLQNDEDYIELLNFKDNITKKENSYKGKYFELKAPISFDQINDIPVTKYTHLYIHKPDTNIRALGYTDFILGGGEFFKLKKQAANIDLLTKNGTLLENTKDPELIKITNPKFDILAYLTFGEVISKLVVNS